MDTENSGDAVSNLQQQPICKISHILYNVLKISLIHG